MLKNHPKIYTKPQNIGECSKWRDLALLEMWTRDLHNWNLKLYNHSNKPMRVPDMRIFSRPGSVEILEYKI